VSSIDRRVYAEPLGIYVVAQRYEQTVPLTRLRPPVEAIEHRFPWAKLARQVAPRNSRATPPKHRLEKQAVVLRRPAHVIVGPKERLNLPPPPVVELLSNHRDPLMEHDFRRMDSSTLGTGPRTRANDW